MIKRFKKAFQQGISLLEVMLSLSIIAVILVMAVRYYSVTSQSNNTNVTTEVVENLESAMHQYKAMGSTFTGLNPDKLCAYGLVPVKNLVCTATCTTATTVCTIPNPLGVTPIALAPSADGASATITISNIPAGSCQLLGTYFEGANISGCTTSGSTSTLVVTVN